MTVWKRWLMLGLVVATAFAARARAQEVERQEVLRLGDHVQHVDGFRSPDDDAFVDVMGPPADDNHKWFITVVSTKGCPACARLKADLARDPYLRALVNVSDPKQSWSHFNSYLYEDESQQFRWEKIKLAGFPTVLVQPPLNKKYGDPATVVFQTTGYDGNGQKLATKITAAIKAYLAKQDKRNVAPRQTVGHRQQVPVADEPYGIDPPWTPAPKVEPPVAPAPAPVVDIPVIPPPNVEPAPKPQPEADVSTYPEAIVVTDADDGLDAENDSRVRRVLEALRQQRGKNLKVRLMDWRDAKERFPVARDEVPVILVTQDGQIQDKISGRLLPFLETQPREVTLSDIPWSAVITLLTTGFSLPAAIALGVWLVRFIRSRREAAGKPRLFNDATVEQVLSLLQTWLASRTPKPPAA